VYVPIVNLRNIQGFHTIEGQGVLAHEVVGSPMRMQGNSPADRKVGGGSVFN